MGRSVNQVMLMGNLTRDPESRKTNSGKTVVQFSLAVSYSEDSSDFFDIVAWEKQGELVERYLRKGNRCLVQGRLNTSRWEQDGQKRQRVEVIAQDVVLLSPKQENNQSNEDVAPEDIDDKPIDLSEILF